MNETELRTRISFLERSVEETKLTIRELINGPSPGESQHAFRQRCRDTLFCLTGRQGDR